MRTIDGTAPFGLIGLGVMGDNLALNVPRVGRRSAKPQQQLLDIMGLHPSSVEFHLQILDGADRIWNEYKLGSKRRTSLEAVAAWSANRS